MFACVAAYGPITLWQVHWEKVEAVTDFIFLGSKITADSDSSHKIKRHLLLGRKAMMKLDIILKAEDITFPKKVYIVKAMIFPVSHMEVRVGPQRRLSAEELTLSDCGAREDY